MGFQMKQLQRFSKTILLSAIFTTVTMSTTVTHAKQYYKWVDSKGSTHYTTTPPPKSAKKKGQVDTYGWHNSHSANAAPSTPSPAPQDTQPPVSIPQLPQSAIPSAPSAPSAGSAAAPSMNTGQMVAAPIQYDRNGKIIEPILDQP